MPDREKVIEALESCVANPLHRKGDKFVISFDVRFANAIIELLKKQEAVVKQWTKEIADNQLAHAPNDSHEFMSLDEHLENEYKRGIWDGLQIAWNIISEGR